MATRVDESMSNPPLKTQKLSIFTQITLRVLAFAAVLSAVSITFTSKQTVEVYGIVVDARYSYFPAFRFFAFANVIAGVFSVLLVLIAFALGSKAVNPTYYFYVFLHDLIMTMMLTAGCAATTAVGYIGKHGNSHTGWVAACDHFTKFCNRIIVADVLSYVSILLYVTLTIISANKSRQLQV